MAQASKKTQVQMGKIRPNQFLASGGPGAIHNSVHDSVTIKDIDFWDYKNMSDIDEPGLARRLGVDTLKGFPDSTDNEKEEFEWGLPAVSFPRYHVCKTCGRLYKVGRDYPYYSNKGPLCPNRECREANKGESYPVGYMLVCEDGHMDDIPWNNLITHKKDNEGHPCAGIGSEKENLKLEIDNSSTKWRPKKLICNLCGAEEELTDGKIWGRFNNKIHCSRYHPQRDEKDPNCDNNMKVIRRDSSSVYYSVTQRTVSIPSWKDRVDDFIYTCFNRTMFEEVQYADINGTLKNYYNEKIKKDYDDKYTEEDFINAYDRINDAARNQGSMNKVFENLDKYGVVDNYADIKEMEYSVITNFETGESDSSEKKLTLVDVSPSISSESKKYFSRLIRIKKMNEVNALIGFTREEPPDPSLQIRYKVDAEDRLDNDHICRLAKGKSSWLPAVETRGEGIFIELNNDTVDEWKRKKEVSTLSEIYRFNYKAFLEERHWNNAVYMRDARYVLLHTLSHILIKEMSLYSGYEQPSLKERIYCSDKMCGLLIYTGSPDREGSLGGLQELGDWKRFAPVLKSALKRATICSQDPQCSLKSPAMTKINTRHNLNGASCCSCTMIPDISCEYMNRLLDRALIVPLHGREKTAFFSQEYINTLHI